MWFTVWVLGCLGQVKALQQEIEQLEGELEDLKDHVDELEDAAADSDSGLHDSGMAAVTRAPSVVFSLVWTTTTEGGKIYDLAWEVEGDVVATRTSLYDSRSGTTTTLGAVPCGEETFEYPDSLLTPVVETWTANEYACWTNELTLFPHCRGMVKVEEFTCEP